MRYREKVLKDLWLQCEICGKSLSQMESVGKRGAYRSVRFKNHVENKHDMTLSEYFDKVGLFVPRCVCGCGKLTPISPKGSELVVKRCIRWHPDIHNSKRVEANKRMRESRLGAGNPMYGAIPWNKGLTKETSDLVNGIASKLKGHKHSFSARMKMSESAKQRTIHGHTGCHHSEATKNKIREATLRQISSGCLGRLRSRPHCVFAVMLDSLGIDYEEEKIEGNFSFDFYIPHVNVYVEVDGDYYHSHPCAYPDGPITKTQKKNAYRDGVKNHFCLERGMVLVRFWERDILKNGESVLATIKGICNAASN